MLIGKELTLSQETNLRPCEIQNICRQIQHTFGENELQLSDREENIVGKGENTGYQHFLLCPPCFQTIPSQGCEKPGLVQ